MEVKVCMRDSYSVYKASVDKPLKLNPYLNIIHAFIKFVMKKVCEGYIVNLGARLGYIGVRGKKAIPVINDAGEIKGVAPNWGKTKAFWLEKAKEMGISFEEYLKQVPKEQRQLIYCFNEHSNGLIYSIHWYKKKAVIANKMFYNLKFSRDNKRTVSKLAFEGKEYIASEI